VDSCVDQAARAQPRSTRFGHWTGVGHQPFIPMLLGKLIT